MKDPSILRRSVIFLFLMMEMVSGMETLESQLNDLREGVELLTQENIKDKEWITHLEQRVAVLESSCGSSNNHTQQENTQSESEDNEEEEENAYEETILLIGGETQSGRSSSVSVLQNSNCVIPDYPYKLASLDAVSNNEISLVCGGFYKRGRKSKGRARDECYNLVNNNWELHSRMSRRRHGHSMVSVPGSGVWVFGGYGDDIKNSSEFLPTGSDTWVEGPSIPGGGVKSSCAVALNTSHILIAGGGDDRDQVLVYDVTTDQWTDWPRLPFGRDAHDCIKTEDGVLLTGGHGRGGSYSKASFMIDLYNGQVETVGSLTAIRSGMKLVEYQGKVWVMGGSGYVTPYSLEEWDPEAKVWVNKPWINISQSRYYFAVMRVPYDICE